MSTSATLWASAPADLPEVGRAALLDVFEEHTDLDPSWLNIGRVEREDGRVETYADATQKYSVDGLEDAAAALSEAHPGVTVTCRQEWNEDNIGGSGTTYLNGRAIAREELSWHPVVIGSD